MPRPQRKEEKGGSTQKTRSWENAEQLSSRLIQSII